MIRGWFFWQKYQTNYLIKKETVGESNFNSGKSQGVLSLMINKDFLFHVLLYVKSHNDESFTVIE